MILIAINVIKVIYSYTECNCMCQLWCKIVTQERYCSVPLELFPLSVKVTMITVSGIIRSWNKVIIILIFPYSIIKITISIMFQFLKPILMLTIHGLLSMETTTTSAISFRRTNDDNSDDDASYYNRPFSSFNNYNPWIRMQVISLFHTTMTTKIIRPNNRYTSNLK